MNLHRPARLAVCAILVAGCSGPQSEIVFEETSSSALAAADSHTHEIGTGAGQFVTGTVNQESVDVIVNVVDPDDNVLEIIDSSARGAEHVRFTTRVAGIHKLVISPYEQEEGEYSVGRFLQEPTATTPVGKIDQLMSLYNDDTPGGVVAVTRGGEIVFSKGYGLANVEHRAPNLATTPWHMASVSKQFTGMAIVLLHLDGRLDLDDDVRKHLPDLPDFGDTITLRHLLNHTSGLRDHWNLWATSGGRMDDVIRQEDIYRLVLRQRELNFEPGAENLYSNTGYMLLSEVVSAVAEQPFGEWMKANVFDPLGMHATQIYDDHTRIVPGRAYSYADGEDGLVKAVLSYANSGATSLFTTAEDLAKWLGNFKSGAVGGAAAIEMLQVQGVLNDGEVIDYALGIGVSEQNGLRRLSHSGGDAGFRTWLGYYPEIDAGVIVLGNKGGFDAGSIGVAAANAFFEADMSFEAEETATEQDAGATPVTPTDLGSAVAGRFAIEEGPYVDFEFADGALTAQVEGQPAFNMRWVADSEFTVAVPGDEVSVRFDVETDGSVATATLVQGSEFSMRRVEEWQPDAESLAIYSGRYYSDELETFYTVTRDADALTINHIRHGEAALRPQEEHVFATDAWFIGSVTFSEDESGEFSRLHMTSGRVRNLRFEKVSD